MMKFKKNILTIAVVVATSTLTACGSSSDSEANVAPTAITLSNSAIDENASGIDVGTLSATDANQNDTFTFNTDNTDFIITGNTLSLAEGSSFDYESQTDTALSVTVTDSEGATYTQELTVSVNDLLDFYGFNSSFINGESSVSYSGQTSRHALIAELKHYIGDELQTDLDNGVLTTKAEIIAKLNTYFNGESSDWEDGVFPITFMDAKQATFSDISSSLKTLEAKVAGNDAAGQHKLWNDGDFAGWGVKGAITPTELIEFFFDQLADNAMENLGGVRYAPGTTSEIAVYVNYDGTDLNQLIQKFLLMSITYSQATDDYLGEETDGKGLTTDNISGDSDGTKAYSKLEHQFDEGFGYFGAARDYLSYNDNEIAGKVSSDEDGRSDWNGQHDTDGDGEIDLLSEINFGNSVNAAKRDRGTVGNTNPTDYSQDAMDAFLAGRNLINVNSGASLTTEQMTELLGYRDTAVNAWEKAIAATVVHYINELIVDLNGLGTDDFSFADAAKHFSELKGFALGLQFNPYSPITDVQFENIHALIQDAPVLDTTDVDAYIDDLVEARDILQSALAFDAENVTGW
jgi:hypothetical protein